MYFVGTSGWQYPHWKRRFYPAGLSGHDQLAHYSARFQTVEINSTFYHLPEPEVFTAWKRGTPPDFVMALKMSRFLTHLKRLRDPEDPIKRFLERAHRLGDRLGPILIQLPPRFRVDPDRLEATLGRFRSQRVAVEFRDDSWYSDEIRAILTRHQAALVLADRGGLLTPEWKTAGWGFARFHEGKASPGPCYGEAALATWVDRLEGLFGATMDVYCYFNNDGRACAVRDAITFARLAARRGLPISRVPNGSEVNVD